MATIQMYAGAVSKALFVLGASETITSVVSIDNIAGEVVLETSGNKRFVISGSDFVFSGTTPVSGEMTAIMVYSISEAVPVPLVEMTDFGGLSVTGLVTSALATLFNAQANTIYDAVVPDLGQADEMIGGNQADTIYSDSGEDQIDAMGGNDQIRIAVGDGAQAARVIHIDGGDGTDTLYFDGSGAIDPVVNLDLLGQVSSIERVELIGGIRVEADENLFRAGRLGAATQVFSQSGASRFVMEVGAIAVASVANVRVAGDVAFTLIGAGLDDAITGNAATADLIQGFDGNDSLNGLGGADSLEGHDGNDRLDGGLGADTMVGGIGNDTYLVDDIGDVVVEDASAGDDTILTSINLTLGENIENGAVLGNSGRVLRGNGLGNALTGGVGADSLHGGDGDDILRGGNGNDLLAGEAGVDTLIGGGGNDTYLLTDRDVVFEESGGGIDLIRTALRMTLAANIEDGKVVGSAASALWGNSLDNVLTGNAGADTLKGGSGHDLLRGYGGNDSLVGGWGQDTLNGGSGADRMAGAQGNDTYIVDNIGDVVVEKAGQGHDLIKSAVSYTLSYNVEDGQLTGYSQVNLTGNNAANDLTGNRSANKILGGNGADTITGLAGDDTLTGGWGQDTFVIRSGHDRDRITDFDAKGAVHDTLDLSGVRTITGFNDLVQHHLSQVGANAVIDAGYGTVITLVGVGLATLDAGDFVF